ncbi:MAG TPA: BrnT family toxin [Thermoanaerobaculia bacterium]
MDVLYALRGVTFTWDVSKAAANLRKHRVSFESAAEAFFDPFLHARAPRVVDGEVRQAMFGLTPSWQLLYVAFALREDSVRIISARPATRLERKRYEDSSAP